MTYTYTQSDSVGFLMSSDFRAVHDDDHACDTAPCRWGSGGMPCKGLVPQKVSLWVLSYIRININMCVDAYNQA